MFPNGWPGCGLLLLRIADGVFVFHQGLEQLSGSQHTPALLPINAFAVIAGAMLLFGIWTPIVGALLALLEIALLLTGAGRSEDAILACAISLAVAMLGPGVWSVDAALFGRQRLEFPKD